MESHEKNRWLAVASTIGWIWCAFLMLTFIALIFPVVVGGIKEPVGMVVFSLIPLALGFFSGLSAFGIRRQREPYHIVAIVTAAVTIFFLYNMRVAIRPLGILLNLIILVIVVVNRKRFTAATNASE